MPGTAMKYAGMKLLVLGGTRMSCEIIKAAKKLGVRVVVTDYLADSPGKKLADEHHMISTTDTDGVVALIRREQIDGMLTGFTDSLLPYYGDICAKAGIPCYGTPEQFKVTTDKTAFKQLCRAFDVPVVQEYPVSYPFSRQDLDQIEYPVLLKPADNSGGRGIHICACEAELVEKYPLSRAFSPGDRVLVETYMHAREATAFYLLQDGGIKLSALADRHLNHQQDGVIPLPVAYTFPSGHLKRYQATLNHKVIWLFASLGLRNGMIFIQMFIKGDAFFFYEMGYRLTGSLEYKIIEQMNGINPMELMVHFALTGRMSESHVIEAVNPAFTRFGFNITFLARPGRIGKIEGVEAVLALDQVIDVVTAYDEGETIPIAARGTLKQIVIRVLGVAETKAEMVALMQRIHQLISVSSAEGENMLLDPVDPARL